MHLHRTSKQLRVSEVGRGAVGGGSDLDTSCHHARAPPPGQAAQDPFLALRAARATQALGTPSPLSGPKSTQER